MASVFDEVMYYSTRFKTELTYLDYENVQKKKEIFGSGIWLGSSRGGKHLFFVTNRHLVDFDFDKENWKRQGLTSISNVDIELRKYSGNTPLSETAFFDIVSIQNKIYYPKDGSDLAVIAISISLAKLKEAGAKGFKPFCLAMDSYLAGKEYFDTDLKAIDGVTFIGFPSGDYDHANNLPIARNANIASDPKKIFKNDWIEGDLILLSGLSFGGSSGSPVYSLPVGNPAIGVGRVLSPKLIGIVSGHLVDRDRRHKGLSYLVKSTKIMDVLMENGLLS